MEELSDHGLTDAYSRPEERRRGLEWLAERSRQGSLNPLSLTHLKMAR
jgi:hypothetical protein